MNLTQDPTSPTAQLFHQLASTKKALQDLYPVRIKLTGDIYAAVADVTSAESALRKHRDEVLLSNDPKELGANEAIREAKVRSLCADQLTAVQSAERIAQTIRANADAIDFGIAGLRAELRVLEAQVALVTGQTVLVQGSGGAQ